MLTLVALIVEAGFEVVGFDVDPEKAETISKRQSYFRTSHMSEWVWPSIGDFR